MITSILLGLREGLEAALIVGIVLAAIGKINRPDLKKTVWFGVGLAILFSVLAAVGLFIAGAEFAGSGEVIFEGITMLLAAILLTWMLLWMNKQSRNLKNSVAKTIEGTSNGIKKAPLFWLVLFAVLREGVELALFLLAASFSTEKINTLLGASLGLFAAVTAGWLLNLSARKISLRRFFQVSNYLLVLFAAGLFAHGIHEFAEVGWLPTGLDPLYNISAVLSQQSIGGGILKALFGYNPTPMLIETLAYAVYLVVLICLTIIPWRKTNQLVKP